MLLLTAPVLFANDALCNFLWVSPVNLVTPFRSANGGSFGSCAEETKIENEIETETEIAAVTAVS